MNLTSKRMLQFLSVCAGAFALTAAAQTTTYVSDSFEDAAIDSAAGVYKAIPYGQGDAFTNYLWAAGEGDNSTIVALEGDGYVGTRPITGTSEKVLKLETEGTNLTRYVNFEPKPGGEQGETQPTTVSFADIPVYVDTLIRFTPSEDDPDVTDTSIKLAFFVNNNSNLVMRHKYLEGSDLFPTNSVFTDIGIINPEHWYRLTIKLRENSYEEAEVLVWLDGIPLKHSNGGDKGNEDKGPLFYTVDQSERALNHISFQGTGYVDDLVVTQNEPDGIQTAGLMLTLSFGNDVTVQKKVGDSYVAVTTGAEIASNTELAIKAGDWYQITNITGTAVSFTGPLGQQVNCTTGTISTTSSGDEATILISQYTGNIATGLAEGHPYATVDAGKLAAWAVNSGLTEAQVIANAADYLDNYLLNIDESINAEIVITSIVYDAGTGKATITVEAINDNDAVNFKSINGTLVVQATDNLTTAFSEAEATEFSFTIDGPGEVVTFTVEATAGNFIRAVVK